MLKEIKNIEAETKWPPFFRTTFSNAFSLNENVWISIKISLKFVPKGPISNIPALVHIMAWRRPSDKPLFEPMMISLPTHIYVTRLQWVKTILNNWIWRINLPGDKQHFLSGLWMYRAPMTHICVSKLSHSWLRCWSVACSMTNYDMNQTHRITNWTVGW